VIMFLHRGWADVARGWLSIRSCRRAPLEAVAALYCFRHTYATFRLTEGVDAYFLAKQMGTL
jgi:integrase